MARNKKPYRATLINGMYKPKKTRIKYGNTDNLSLRSRVERQVEKSNKRLKRLSKGIDINRSAYNPKTKRWERKGTYTIINKRGKRVRIKPTKIVNYKGSFATKKLSILDQYDENLNQIILTGDESYQELVELDRLTNNFLNSKTSTLEGIQEVEENIKENIGAKMDEYDLKKEDIESLYDFFEDPDFQYLRKYFTPSELWEFISLLNEDDSMDVNDWLGTIEDYIGSDAFGVDEDLRDKLINIYNKARNFNDLL